MYILSETASYFKKIYICPGYHHISHYNDTQLHFCYNMASWMPMATLSWQKMNYAQGQKRRPITNLSLSDVWCEKVVFQTFALSTLCKNTQRKKERKKERKWEKVTRMDLKKKEKKITYWAKQCTLHLSHHDQWLLNIQTMTSEQKPPHFTQSNVLVRTHLYTVSCAKQNGTKEKLCSIVQRIK